MILLKRTDSTDSDFVRLVKLLDLELAERDGSEHAYYAQFNKIDSLKYVVLASDNGKPVACGAIREFEAGTMEVKRMYTRIESRSKGIAVRVLTELEKWASELKCTRCVLETGKKQPEAIRLYEKSGYRIIPSYGQYAGMGNSICFEKLLVRPETSEAAG